MTLVAGRVRRWLVRAPLRGAPLGVRATAPLGSAPEEGDAVWITPEGPLDPVSLSLTLPEVSGLVFIGPVAGSTGVFSRLLGREIRVPRAVRGSALLIAGYRNIGGAVDPASGLDLCWGER